jgi:hypothetical protein
MHEQEIRRLVGEIENISFREFWWGSELLDRASRVRDVRVVRVLALRHHGLSNKNAFSAHVVRNTIKTIDAPEFPLSWSIIDSEKDSDSLVHNLEDFGYAPWAIAFILGEIGGAGALRGVAVRLGPEHSARHYMIVRITSHLLVRYLQIHAPTPRTMTVIDVETGAVTRAVPEAISSPTHKMDLLRRSQADEFFTLLEPSLVQIIRDRLEIIPDQVLNLPREDFFRALDKIPKRFA